MAGKLDRAAVKAWLSGQRRVQEVLQRERVQFLLSLTPSRSLEIYLGLAEAGSRSPGDGPSPVLLALRGALARRQESHEL